MNLDAIIIAGGKGTRIRSISGDQIPKALVRVAGEPIVFFQLRLLARYGVKRVAVMAGHLADKLKAAIVPEAANLGLQIEFFVEEGQLGTAGGLTQASGFPVSEDFLVVYGDIAVDMDLMRLHSRHRMKKAAVTIVAHPNDHPHESDLLSVDEEGRVAEILQKKGRVPGNYRNIVPAGIYCCSRAVFEWIRPGEPQDFIRDVFPAMLKGGAPVFAYRSPEYLRDMGTPERYEMVERDIRSGMVAGLNWSVRRPAVFFDRDGVLVRDPGGRGVTSVEELEMLPGAAAAVRMVNEKGWLAVLVTNQPQIAKGFLTFEGLSRVHAKLETLLGMEGARLDEIYFCPHHPERGFEGEIRDLKIECKCRKPMPGMLHRADAEMPVDLPRSIMIGDSCRDVGAAHAAGIPCYGVRTGAGCMDCSDSLRPDRMFENVEEVCGFITGRNRRKEGLKEAT